jgi:AraC-like DNA-binding protein
MKLYIKNMVCFRCELIVKSELNNLGVPYISVKLGEAEIANTITPEKREQINVALKNAGLELLNDQRSILVEKIKHAIIDLVHFSDMRIRVNLSDYLSEKLNHDYTYLSNIFSQTIGTSIEQFFIRQRIERAKELLAYDEYNLNEIADKLHYSSAAHLSSQFKKITDISPSHFRQLEYKPRRALESV